MRTRIILLGSGLAALMALLASSIAGAATQNYAVALSPTKLYLLGAGAWTGQRQLSGFSGTSLSGITIKNDLAFVTDSVTNQLHILRLKGAATETPSVETVRTISLQHVERAGSVAIDSTGGVYVIGKGSWADNGGNLHYSYAYIRPDESGDWSQPIDLNVYDLSVSPNHAPMVDVAALASGAVIVHQYPTQGPGATYLAKVGSDGVAVEDIHLGTGNSYPRGVAVDTSFGAAGYAYVINSNHTYAKTLSVVDATTSMAIKGNYELPEGISPDDITAAAILDDQGNPVARFLGLSGTNDTNSASYIWKVSLGSDGLPDINNAHSYLLGSLDSFTGHHVAASDDGSVFWVASSGTRDNKSQGVVEVLDSGSWQRLSGGVFEMNAPMSQIVSYNYVPEPSSIATLLVLGAGTALSAIRRRKA